MRELNGNYSDNYDKLMYCTKKVKYSFFFKISISLSNKNVKIYKEM
jgi:hypothetical protein